jgi:hypothetical protein
MSWRARTRDHRRGSSWGPALVRALIAVLVGVAIGYPAGRWRDRMIARPTRPEPTARAAPDEAAADLSASEIISAYREQVLRLRKARNTDSAALRDKEIMLQMMQNHGTDQNAAACRRLECEIDGLQTKILQSDQRLAKLRDQLAELVAAHDADSRRDEERDDGLDEEIEVGARRVVLEHELLAGDDTR